MSAVVDSHPARASLSDIRHSRLSRKELAQTERMGREPRNRGRWPNAADWASHDAAQLCPPLPFALHVAVNRVVSSTLVEVTGAFDDPGRPPEHIGRIHLPGAMLDLPTYHHILASLGDELHGLSRTVKDLKR